VEQDLILKYIPGMTTLFGTGALPTSKGLGIR
jgi:hypothetical protein